MAAFRLTSPVISADGRLPRPYTAAGDDISPPLRWEGVPEGAAELVLVCEDPDGDEGVVTHWLVYAILPEELSELPEGLPQSALLDDPEICQGLNEFDVSGYSGVGQDEDRGTHRIFFRLYALDTELLDLPPGATRRELREALKGHVIATAELVGIV